jgi:hypothetical protein
MRQNYYDFMTLHVIICRNLLICGRNSAVECQLPKLKVTGSNPAARSNKINKLDLLPTSQLLCSSF